MIETEPTRNSRLTTATAEYEAAVRQMGFELQRALKHLEKVKEKNRTKTDTMLLSVCLTAANYFTSVTAFLSAVQPYLTGVDEAQ